MMTRGDREPLINLEILLGQVHEEAALDLAIAYDHPPRLKLKDED